jgi:hypothetical protein
MDNFSSIIIQNVCLRSWDREMLMYSNITNEVQRYTMVFITINALHFQAVPPPIIRSSKLYTQNRVFVEIFLLLTAIVSELECTGTAWNMYSVYSNKHHCVKLHLVACAWIYVYKTYLNEKFPSLPKQHSLPNSNFFRHYERTSFWLNRMWLSR